MRKEIIIPPGDTGVGHNDQPFFYSLPFTYRVSYLGPRNRTCNIEYLSPHEIILNIPAFRREDTVTYIDKNTGQDAFTITIDHFVFTLTESMLDASASDLELLYGRLLLTNKFSKRIADRGKLLTSDHHLTQFLLDLKGGIDDYYLQPNYYLKCRRPSVLHLRAVILSRMDIYSISTFHISIPSTLPNQGLLVELLRMAIPREHFHTYSYNPHPEEGEVIIPTDISREIVQVINQLVN